VGGGRALRLGQTWQVAAWEIAHLGEYPWEVAVWENAFGKVPNILIFSFFTWLLKTFFWMLIILYET